MGGARNNTDPPGCPAGVVPTSLGRKNECWPALADKETRGCLESMRRKSHPRKPGLGGWEKENIVGDRGQLAGMLILQPRRIPPRCQLLSLEEPQLPAFGGGGTELPLLVSRRARLHSAVCDHQIRGPKTTSGCALKVMRARPGSAISRRNSFQPWPFRVTRLGRAAGARTARFPLLPLSPHPPLSPSSWYPLS